MYSSSRSPDLILLYCTDWTVRFLHLFIYLFIQEPVISISRLSKKKAISLRSKNMLLIAGHATGQKSFASQSAMVFWSRLIFCARGTIKWNLHNTQIGFAWLEKSYALLSRDNEHRNQFILLWIATATKGGLSKHPSFQLVPFQEAYCIRVICGETVWQSQRPWRSEHYVIDLWRPPPRTTTTTLGWLWHGWWCRLRFHLDLFSSFTTRHKDKKRSTFEYPLNVWGSESNSSGLMRDPAC